MTEIRCEKCNKLLCKCSIPLGHNWIETDRHMLGNISSSDKFVTIKCPRCGKMTTIPFE